MSDNEQGQPRSDNENNKNSQNLEVSEGNAFKQRELMNETIEQEAETSNHTNGADVDVKDPDEPARARQPKSIANEE